MSACTTTTSTFNVATAEETAATVTTSDYTCSLPGPRHGHGALSFTVLGKMITYAIFGGEASDLVPASTSATSILSKDLHTLHFTPTTVTWIKLWTSCDDSGYGDEPSCPPKRRDAAISILGNNAGNTNRFVVYGGRGKFFSLLFFSTPSLFVFPSTPSHAILWSRAKIITVRRFQSFQRYLCVAVYCSALQCVAVRCSTLQ